MTRRRSLALVAAAGLSLTAAQTSEPTHPGTAAMVRRLAELAAAADPATHCCVNERRVELLEDQLASAQDPQRQLELATSLALQRLRAGDSRGAIRDFEALRGRLTGLGAPRESGMLLEVRELLALAHLRLGEQENCVAHHGSQSCLLPIRGSGIHRVQRGSRQAALEYERLLQDMPERLDYRWLLNLAYMTLGEHPDGVPARWRLPPELFESQGASPRFAEVATSAGVAVNARSGGAVVEDLDGDGRLDILTSAWGLDEQIRFFRNRGDGRFEDATDRAGLAGITGGLNLVHADYDNDGDADVLVLRGAWLFSAGRLPNSLLRNEGGRFVDVTEEAGLLSFHPTQTAAWGDYDNDGWLDLFIGNETSDRELNYCELYRNEGGGRFTEVGVETGLDHVGFVKGAVWGDYDNDGWLDLYISQLGEPNALYRNLGDVEGARFADVTHDAGVAGPTKSFPVWFWDYDNDGWLDLVVAPFSGFLSRSLEPVVAERMGRSVRSDALHLYRNRGDGTFEEVAEQTGLAVHLLAMGASYGDLDNDGYPDAYFGTGEPDLATLIPNRAFRNQGGKRFVEITSEGGFGHLQKGHAVAFGDLDDDGDQDVYVNMGGAYSGDAYPNALFRNPGSQHHWVTLLLEGVRSNRSAIGARIRVTATGPSGTRRVQALVGSGGSFGSSSLQQEIGLGDAVRIDGVTVRWPGGSTQSFSDVPVDRFVRLREGASSPEVLERVPFTVGGVGPPEEVHR